MIGISPSVTMTDDSPPRPKMKFRIKIKRSEKEAEKEPDKEPDKKPENKTEDGSHRASAEVPLGKLEPEAKTQDPKMSSTNTKTKLKLRIRSSREAPRTEEGDADANSNKEPAEPEKAPEKEPEKETDKEPGKKPEEKSLVGLIYDQRMESHRASYAHCECPERTTEVWEMLKKEGILDRCILLESEEVSEDLLNKVHAAEYVVEIFAIARLTQRRRDMLSNKYNAAYKAKDDMYLSSGSAQAAAIASGCIVKATDSVYSGRVHSAFAVVRPPGHHAFPDHAEGFCLLNNAAVGTTFLLEEKNSKRIMIFDFDVHHGNGTQEIFYRDSRVLFISIHRYGNFYTDTGNFTEVGEGGGYGYTINIPLPFVGCTDGDYLLAFEEIVKPIATKFDPEIVLVSAGFDAAKGDVGEFNVSPEGFAAMVEKLQQFAHGNIVLALEGGYNLDILPRCIFECVTRLLGDPHDIHSPPARDDAIRDHIFKIQDHLCSLFPNLWDSLIQRREQRVIRTKCQMGMKVKDSKITEVKPATETVAESAGKQEQVKTDGESESYVNCCHGSQMEAHGCISCAGKGVQISKVKLEL